MSHPIAVEVNCETKQVTERPLTDAEITQRRTDAAASAIVEAEREAEEEAKAASMASALAKLSALGLTDDEVAALTR